jgi:hypothetical protein
MRKTLLLSVACISFLAFSLPAFAGSISIQYDVENLGSGKWQYDYTVNGAFTEYANGFIIYFDQNLYESIISYTTSLDWDPIVHQPDSGSVPLSGSFDELAKKTLSVGSFSVVFAWSGSGTPGSQPFDFYSYDSVLGDVQILDSGNTTSVPEASSSLILLGISFAGIAIARCKIA